jgi:predicted PurR-regulated permease PerM
MREPTEPSASARPPEPPAPPAVPAPLDLAQVARSLDSRREERRALGVLAAIAVAAMVWIASPVGIGILLGMLIAFSLQPFYEQLAKRTGRPRLTAFGFMLVSTVGLLATLGGLSSLFVARGLVMAQALIASLTPGGAIREVAEKLSARLGPLQFRSDELAARLHAAAADVAARAATIAAALATATFDVMLTLFFAMMTLSFVLVRWVEIATYAEELLPLRPRYTHALLEEFQRVGRTTLLGTVLTGLAQGVFAALGYWLTGVPEAAFFGAATAVASLLPGVGTMLVWVPAGIFLIATGHPGRGVLELIWGALLVVGVSDYVIRPRLVGHGGSMPALLTFTALFGGVEVFGLAGLVVGPLIMSVSFAVLRIFAQEAGERRAHGERHA